MGEDGEVVPHNATHVTVDKSVKVIPRRAFYGHPNIEEFECHDGVEKFEGEAFVCCTSLRRVKMPGVKIVEYNAFWSCNSLASWNELEIWRIGILSLRTFEEHQLAIYQNRGGSCIFLL